MYITPVSDDLFDNSKKSLAPHVLKDIGTALTFDDVQLVPQYSVMASRTNLCTTTAFTRNFCIDKPIVAAPMDSVCGATMAKALWKAGCVGVIHRFMSIDEQVAVVREVKAYIDEQVKIPTVRELGGYRIRMPVIAAAIGATETDVNRAVALVESGANVIVIDVAHGHHINVKKILATIIGFRTESPYRFDIIAGNIATEQAALDLVNWGADGLRVGIGGGSVCETRVRTGVGVPQLTAVDNITSVTDVPVISDGGIRYPGDIAKALAAGATTVMVGSLLAGTDEAPGDVFIAGQWPNNKTYKMYRGSASATIKMEKTGAAVNVEGAAKMVECKGSVVVILNDLMDGVRSAMSYLGVHDVESLWSQAEFVRISNAGLREAHPHLL